MNTIAGSFPTVNAIISITLLAIAGHTDAGVLSGGELQITVNNSANLVAGLSIGPGAAATSLYIADYLPKSAADVSSVGAMGSLADNVYPEPVTEVFAVNSNPLGSGVPTANSLGGRNNQSTTLSWAPSQDHLSNSSSFNATGQIGFDGVEIYKGSFHGFLGDGDYSLKFSAARQVNGNSGWALYNNMSFAIPSFDIRGLSVTTNGNALIMSGQLWWSAEMTDFLFGGPGDLSQQAGKYGTFSFNSSVAVSENPVPVPLPAGAELAVAIGLLSLLQPLKACRA